ncbi:MAG: hypothetical protein H6624_13355 [Bdellovibrionaceae bacterium]|nr:hypothetical protein [Bdellovibrionales bacterium]MCB9085329.1 hypothetical protein [Pseudobdellovibrionaceae bacterium]
MKRILCLSLLLSGVVSGGSVGAAVLVEDNGVAVNQSTYSAAAASDGLEFRRKRKVGLGLAGAGPWGVMGTHLELNFASDISLQAGVGLGSGFQTFALQLRKFIPGKWFLPYISAGVARWYTTGEGDGAIDGTTPGFLAKRFLSGKEKREGRFSELLVFPSLGMQYLQLSGEWAGSTLYAEFNLLVDVEDFVLGPTGSLGYTYFF